MEGIKHLNGSGFLFEMKGIHLKITIFTYLCDLPFTYSWRRRFCTRNFLDI